MAVSKVILNGETLMDVTVDTVTSEKLLSGYQATGRDGVKVQGSYVPATVSLTSGSADPSESSQHITPPSGYDGFSYFDVGAIDSDYIGSAIARESSADLIASGSVIIAPAGYYAAAASKSVQSGSVTTPSVTITATPSITIDDNGVINVTVADSSNISPTVVAGYISQGTAGTITVSASGNKGMGTYGARTITPGTSTYALQPKNYLTGLITIQGDSDLISSNIKDNVKIFDVTGTFTDSSTVSAGQTAASSSEIMQGYSAWVNGQEVKGVMATTSIVEGITTVSGSTATRGIAEWSSGNIASGYMNAATFANSSSAQTQYVDISNTTDAPVLVSGGYLYINKGYTDDLKISLAKLVPDGASADLASDKILSGYAAYNNDGTLIAGNIPTKNSTDVTASGSTVSIPSGYYSSAVSKNIASGSVKVNNTDLVRTPGLTLDNTVGIVTATIPYAQTNVGAALSTGYISTAASGSIGVTGSSSLQLAIAYGSTITPTESSQIAVASGSYTLGNITVDAISSDYIGSNIAQNSSADIIVAGPTITVPSGYYAIAGSTTIKSGSVAVYDRSFNIGVGTISLDSSTGIVSINRDEYNSTFRAVTNAGYIEALEETGQLKVNSASGSYQLATISATTITPLESSQVAAESGKFTLGEITIAAISSNYIGSAIAQRSTDDLTATGSVVNVPNGYYSTAVSTAIKGGAVSAVATPSFNPIFNVDSNGVVTVTQNTVASVLPTLSSGYIDTVSPFTVVVAGSSSYQLSIITTATIDQIVNS